MSAKNSIYDELDGVVASLRKLTKGQEDPMMGYDEDEEEGLPGSDEEEDEDEGEFAEEGAPRRPMRDEQGEGQQNPFMGKSFLPMPTNAAEARYLSKALNTLKYSNQTKKTIISGTEAGGDLQDNFKQEGVQDESFEGQTKFDQFDQGYGGPSPQNPKLMTPVEYQALYNSIMTDGRKGPSINVTTITPQQAYESAKSFGGDDGLVDVTPFMKSFDAKINQIGGIVSGLTQTVSKVAEAQVASSRAMASMMSKSQGRQSAGAIRQVAPAAPQTGARSLSKGQCLGMLEKGVAEGKIGATELTKYELTGQMTPAVDHFISMEGGLR
jgi:hypothetical protein